MSRFTASVNAGQRGLAVARNGEVDFLEAPILARRQQSSASTTSDSCLSMV
jgi:hypothetical protein